MSDAINVELTITACVVVSTVVTTSVTARASFAFKFSICSSIVVFSLAYMSQYIQLLDALLGEVNDLV